MLSPPFQLIPLSSLCDIGVNGCGQVNFSPTYGLLVNNTLLDMVNDFHLEQLVRESTRDNHMLDLIFCTDPA